MNTGSHLSTARKSRLVFGLGSYRGALALRMESEMSKPSNRDAIFAAFARGDSPATIVAALGISKQAVSAWKKKWEMERSTVNASIDQSIAGSHGPNGSPHETSPESAG